MASLRDIRRRITSVKNTRQITRAMKLVSGAKLKRATDAAIAARPYQQALSRTLTRVAQGAGDVEHPPLTQPENKNDVLVIVLTSDRGLCGSFNSTLLRFAWDKIEGLKREGKTVSVLTYGKKARAFFQKRDVKLVGSVIDIHPSTYKAKADELAERLVNSLNANEFERAMLVYMNFKNVMTQVPQFEQVLPMKLEAAAGAKVEAVDYLFEPAGPGLLIELLPMALRTQLFQAFLETQAGEQAARMTAMEAATKNASELITGLTLQYNRARQAAITKELIEIVSGAEAL